MPTYRPKLRDIHAEIAQHCAEISKLFKPANRVSVVVRNPHHGVDGSADVFVSDDDPDAVIRSIEQLKSRREMKLTDVKDQL
jgi:hypothetical protein